MILEIEITIPKRISIARAYATDSGNDLPPAINSTEWVSIKTDLPDTSLMKVCWVKDINNQIDKAFYCVIPFFRQSIWVHRFKDEILDNITHWKHLTEPTKT